MAPWLAAKDLMILAQAAQASKFHGMFFKVFQGDDCCEKDSRDGGVGKEDISCFDQSQSAH